MSHVTLQGMALELGIHVPRSRHFLDFQAGRGRDVEGVVFYVDCRYDSSRSGFHGTVPFINQADNRIVEMITLTRREAGNSWRIETAAISKGIELLRDRGITIAEIIHDDNNFVDSLLNSYGIQGIVTGKEEIGWGL
ncbi:hypothetical protein R1sor_023848 [Riccia sorocarpa]|uniref:Uncharacterized protein n=1 Tax=Riccia sorocarpa TaxID=122646 RepID=A0ABD3GQZ7_9MARC